MPDPIQVSPQLIDVLNQVQTAPMTPQVVLTSGAGMAQLLATGDPKYVTALTEAQSLVKGATDDYGAIGAAAALVLKNFPSG